MSYTNSILAAALSATVLSQIYAHIRRRRRLKSALGDRCHVCSQSDLAEHTKIFDRRIIKVRDHVLVAVGYGLANTICIRGETGLIIIDTLETNQAAEEALRDIRKVDGYDELPIVGIIYTHFHSDHVGGTEALLREASPDCEVWAHHTTREKLLQFNLVMGPIAYVRAVRQFGMFLNKPMLENCGIGPYMRGGRENEDMSSVLPTHMYGEGDEGRRRINIAGIDLELVHAPGETDDQTVVFMPIHKILFAADNFYESFPNLYAIRGVPHRDASQWIASLDTMRSLNADFMVPSHTLPVYGASEISTRLRNYRDAIAYVHDQTVRLALKGCHPNLIANEIQLPAHLRGIEYLKEFYGTVHWSAKAIFNGYLGWFSGEASELMQLDPAEYGEHLVKLGGGATKCVEVAESSISKGDTQWGLELATALLDAKSTPNNIRWRAVEVRTMALKTLAERQVSANARNYFLTSAQETTGSLKNQVPTSKKRKELMSAPINDLLQILVYRVDSAKADGENHLIKIELKDIGRTFVLVLHNSVMTIASDEEGEELLNDMGKDWLENVTVVEVACTESIWRQIMVEPASFAKAVVSGDFVVKTGTLLGFKKFMDCIDKRV